MYDQLEPFTELFEAEINLAMWVAAVRLQRDRLRPAPPTGPGLEVSREKVWSSITQLGADGLMFVLALDQVADAVRLHAPADVAGDINDAIACFEAACPDRRRLRNAVAHYSDYLRGAGVGQQGATSPQASYGLVDSLESFYFFHDKYQAPLEVDFAAAASAAEALERKITATIHAARIRRREQAAHSPEQQDPNPLTPAVPAE